MRILIHLLTLVFLLVCAAATVEAQSTTVQGLLRDQSDAVVPNAAVELKNIKTEVVVRTVGNDQGLFLFPPVVPGDYMLQAETTELKATVNGLKLEVGESRTVNITLLPRQLEQDITVEAAAPQLITERPDRGNVVESEFVENVPLNVRNPLQLINFAQGVTQANSNASGTNVVSQSYTNSFRINGSKGSTTEILLDGAANTVAYANQAANVPQVDAVREFRVLTTAYAPEYGRTSGGVVTYAMQSGSNGFHGTAFEYLRNSVLDANGFNANKSGKPKNHLERNQFGYSVGGPVLLPRIYAGRNRTFFFTSYEGLRETAAGNYVGTVPTARERQGDFSQTLDAGGNLITIYDPATTRLDPSAPAGVTRYIRDAFTGNVIPRDRFNQTGYQILSYYPVPNQAGIGKSSMNNYFSSAPTKSDQNRLDLKIDHQINDHHSFSARWDRFQNVNTYASVYGTLFSPQAGNNRIPGINWELRHTWVINSKLIFEHHFSYGHSESNRTSPNLGFDPTSLGFSPSVTAGAATKQFPTVTASRVGSIGTQAGILERNRSTVWQYAASTS